MDGKTAVIVYFGEKKKALNEFNDLQLGEYVYAQGGYIIKKISEKDAFSILSVWKETFFELQEKDLRLSKLNYEKTGADKKAVFILDKALEDVALKHEDLLYILNVKDVFTRNLIYKTANFLRQKYLSNACCVHGVLEFSNYCNQSCLYCGINMSNTKVRRYRMSDIEIQKAVGEAVEGYGFKALVLQSGEDDYYSAKKLCDIVKKIKEKHSVLIFISCGEVGLEGLSMLYEAGARGLLMRFETSNPSLYSRLHPGAKLEERLAHLREAYRLGYLIATGGLIGLPGQNKEDILNDIYLASELNTEMYSCGPFIPHPDTYLGREPLPSTDDILLAVSTIRLANPKHARILITTGFETLDNKAREKGLLAGGNSVMLNVTPLEYRKQYAIYPNRAHEKEDIQEQIDQALDLLHGLGRAPTDLGIN
jgi:biotin synthase